MLNELTQLGLLLAVAYAIFKSGEAYTLWRIQRDIAALESGELVYEEEEEEDDSVSVESMTIKKVDNVFYAYGTNDRFLCQESDLSGLFMSIKDSFPKTIWLINEAKYTTLTSEEQESILPTLSNIFSNTKE
jgi:hypothetical protein